MKALLKWLLLSMSATDRGWHVLERTLLRASRYAESARWTRSCASNAPSLDVAAETLVLAPDLKVRHGPFRGMAFVEARSCGSVLFPKLLGCYEQELHLVVERLCRIPYTDVVDVGCAEGYYAVGFALRLPSATVHAFDTSETARALCERMATCNKVAERVRVSAACTPEVLARIHPKGRALLFCDCEGYEKTLIGGKAIPHLIGWDVLIEVHDFVDRTISAHLLSALGATHDIETVDALGDVTKVRAFQYPELVAWNRCQRWRLLAENRPDAMRWMLFMSRDGAPGYAQERSPL